MQNTTAASIDPNVPSSEYIFRRLFHVRTREEALQTEQELQTYGARSTGSVKYDNHLYGRLTTCYIPIAKMAMIFDRGFEVHLVNHSDAKTVYEYIQHHLETWMKFMGNGVNAVKAPYEDLRLLDRFATSVYGVAIHQYQKADALTPFGRFMAQFSDLSEDAFSTEVKTKAPAEEIKERPSLQDALIQYQAQLFGG